MTTWHWVRHGPTHQKTFTGWRDVPADLSNTGAVTRLANYLPDDALVISSDLTRSIDTASALRGTRTRLPHDPALREFHFGVWDGIHFSTVAEWHPDLSRAYWEQPGDHTPPGGESWNTSAARVAMAVRRIEAAHPGRDIIAVAHFGVILTQVQAVLGLTAHEVLGQRIEPLSVTTLNTATGTAEVINHLP
ncbi:histidine phosphatase family protein [Tateyamaria sp. ANG-S1]|uniref:histidine phosphatase family protein n=1 Tax=Tateyamaria sp. ANG-S1 TaxID=1577905 RepID=UPI00057D7222|nr:histidine phosphatase family protein [Tateyamaria sp. ANG-S1]KIC50078.1 phosphoglycerate mutase [Tateyamaria sp. ANG-S1]